MNNFDFSRLYNNSYYGTTSSIYKSCNITNILNNTNKPNNKKELFKLLKEQKIFGKFCLALANLTQGKYNITVNENETKQAFMFLQPKTQLNSFIETVLFYTKNNDLNYVRKIINTPYQLKPKIT